MAKLVLLLAASAEAARFSEDVAEEGASSLQRLFGSVCSIEERTEVNSRFQIGPGWFKYCQNEYEWGDSLSWTNPDSPNTWALYLYPEEDHNGAFDLCSRDEKDPFNYNLDPHLCSRLFADMEHYSVMFERVSSVQEATHFVEELDKQSVIKHLVLGGHGNSNSLNWGPAQGNLGMPFLHVSEPNTLKFLAAVYPYLLKGDDGKQSTVFLDACLNAEKVCHTNMLQFVAHQLSGVKVFASKTSWNNEQFSVKGDGAEFSGKIEQKVEGAWRKKQNMLREAQMGTGELKDWKMVTNWNCADERVKYKRGKDLDGCHEACKKDETCKAFVFYQSKTRKIMGKKVPLKEKRCYLSSNCENLAESQQGALLFYKPS